jgi:hypothetical protein
MFQHSIADEIDTNMRKAHVMVESGPARGRIVLNGFLIAETRRAAVLPAMNLGAVGLAAAFQCCWCNQDDFCVFGHYYFIQLLCQRYHERSLGR